ncbi:hypothetical protein [Hyphomicrobium sp. CS1GBMeth3]|jgi:hypothetical protein|uniref:hypothetical protein n=1 Tax=Hyphomicrobium sp. CS1GBMeth3 TaxID=1892845 RepID=UPI0009313481|nr:hypothetical protein [Hyphomicrobium sp. CS1GBMeth3]
MDVSSLTVIDLLKTYGAVLDELRRREIVRSTNNPVSDLAEHLFCTAYPSWMRENNSASGHDAVDPTGLRYQIKARRLHRNNGSRQLSAIRNLPNDPFDFLAGVLFDETFGIRRAAIIPLAVVKERAKHVEHTNSWRFLLREEIWADPGVLDVTERIRKAATSL